VIAKPALQLLPGPIPTIRRVSYYCRSLKESATVLRFEVIRHPTTEQWGLAG
jgi:hypothetical protein